jgi:hypothetical protein
MGEASEAAESARLLATWGIDLDEIEDMCLIPDCYCDGDPHP